MVERGQPLSIHFLIVEEIVLQDESGSWSQEDRYILHSLKCIQLMESRLIR